MAVAIDVGGIQEGNPEFQGAVNGGNRLVPVRRAIPLAHAHAAQTLSADLECSELASGDTHADTSLECRHDVVLDVSARSCHRSGRGR